MNSFDQYYVNQSGSGITIFAGYRFQKGNGFFGRLISGTLLSLLKKSVGFLGLNALEAGVNIGSDLLNSDNFNTDTIKEVSKKRGLEQFKKITKKVLKKLSDESRTGRRQRIYRRREKPVIQLKLISIKGRKKRKQKRRIRKKRVGRVKAKDFLSY